MSTRIAQLFIAVSLLVVSGFTAVCAASLPAPGVTENSEPVNYKPVLIDQPRVYSGTFFTASGGPSLVNWQDFPKSPFVSISDNPKGGVVYGFGTGFRFYPFFGIEGGWVRLPTIKGNGLTNATLPRTVNPIGISSWFGYALARFYFCPPFFKFFYFTFGAGVTYRSINPKPSEQFTNNLAYYYAPIFNLGAEWDIVQDWFVFINYFYVPQFNRLISEQSTKFFNSPDANVFLFGIGYKFSV